MNIKDLKNFRRELTDKSTEFLSYKKKIQEMIKNGKENGDKIREICIHLLKQINDHDRDLPLTEEEYTDIVFGISYILDIVGVNNG